MNTAIPNKQAAALVLAGVFLAGLMALASPEFALADDTVAKADSAAAQTTVSAGMTSDEAKAAGWKIDKLPFDSTPTYVQILDYRGTEDSPAVPRFIDGLPVKGVYIYSPLKGLDVSECIELETLSCSYVGLEKLDLTNNANLQVLNCSNNNLAELDVAHCVKLKELDCNDNRLTSLSLPDSDSLYRVYCQNNSIADLSALQAWADAHSGAYYDFEPQDVPAVDPDPRPDPQPQKTFREFNGYDRYDVARLTLAAALDNDVCKGAIIVSGEDGKFADALAASALSGLLDYPVILTNGSSLSSEAWECLKWLRRSYTGKLDILIVGGSATITQGVADSLQDYGWVTRISGADRYALAERVYQYGEQHGGWNTDNIIVTKGNDFPDALTIAPYASSFQTPILLVDQNASYLDASQRKMLSKHSQAVVLGGEKSVRPVLFNDIDASAPSGAIRLDGADRYEASLAIVEWEISQGMQLNGVGFATGQKFADALSSAFLLSQTDSVLLLVNGTDDSANGEVYDFLEGNSSVVSETNVFGGTASVNERVRASIKASLDW